MDLSKTNRGELFDTLNALVDELLTPGKKNGKAMIEAQRIIERVKGSEPRIDGARHAADMSAIKTATTELTEEAQENEEKVAKKSSKKEELNAKISASND